MEGEVFIRIIFFVAIFALFASLEVLAPHRNRTQPRRARWFTNFSITVLNTISLRIFALILPFLAIGAALDATQKGWGLFNVLSWPLWVELLLSIVFLDFAVWLQHVVMHKVPVFWRIHRVHHADRDMDVTTAVRFHPLEILLSMFLKIGLVYLLGPSALAVVIFEILLNGFAIFNHANLKLSFGLDRVLRLVLVTPDMHRVHHSNCRREHDSNYGFFLSIWDRIFGTYLSQPEAGHKDMTIGLEWQNDQPSKLGWSLTLPFIRDKVGRN
ncbi:MAG: sterol desaturase family protein [Aestuariivita sp.]|nr:sterol desaturase family protein [Aestuariivita sp.]MCY4201298.1 sterol desaturase family protein [Aestuariivita sp.]